MKPLKYNPEKQIEIPIAELLRYAGMPGCKDPAIYQRASEIALQCGNILNARCVYQRYSIDQVEGGVVRLANGPTLYGSLVSKYLCDCEDAILVLATVGLGVDRMIAGCSACSLTDGLLADAAGSAAVEVLLDEFCMDTLKQENNKPRISPGYGDFDLKNQTAILQALHATQNLGVYLNDSLLMSPAKSVSALIGIRKDNYV